MAENNINKRIEDSAVRTAVAEMMDAEGQRLLEEFSAMDKRDYAMPDEKHKKAFEAAVNSAYRNGRIVSFFIGLKKPVQYAMTSFAALIIVFSVSVISVDALRTRFIDWIIILNSDHMAVNAVDTEAEGYNEAIKKEPYPRIIPSGYLLNSISAENETVTSTYKKDRCVLILVKYPKTQTINIDNEDAEMIAAVSVNDSDGILIDKGDTLNLTWFSGNHAYSLFTNDPDITQNLMVQIAESVK